jgi:hypothetical protein
MAPYHITCRCRSDTTWRRVASLICCTAMPSALNAVIAPPATLCAPLATWAQSLAIHREYCAGAFEIAKVCRGARHDVDEAERFIVFIDHEATKFAAQNFRENNARV